jgi:hypothetical protein
MNIYKLYTLLLSISEVLVIPFFSQIKEVYLSKNGYKDSLKFIWPCTLSNVLGYICKQPFILLVIKIFDML